MALSRRPLQLIASEPPNVECHGVSASKPGVIMKSRSSSLCAWLAVTVVWIGCASSETGGASDAASPTETKTVECTNERKCAGSEICILGRCKANARGCQASLVTCSDAAPECPEGSVPSVEDGCWGGCVGAERCWAIDDCAACEQAGFLCVELPRPFGSYFVCSQRDVSGCDPLSCDCLEAVCGGELACDSVANHTVKCVPGGDGNGAAGTEAHYD